MIEFHMPPKRKQKPTFEDKGIKRLKNSHNVNNNEDQILKILSLNKEVDMLQNQIYAMKNIKYCENRNNEKTDNVNNDTSIVTENDNMKMNDENEDKDLN